MQRRHKRSAVPQSECDGPTLDALCPGLLVPRTSWPWMAMAKWPLQAVELGEDLAKYNLSENCNLLMLKMAVLTNAARKLF